MTRWQADALLISVALIWGFAFVPQAWGMEHLGPFAFTGLRFALGALVVAPLAWMEWWQPKVHAVATARGWAAMAGLGSLIFLGAALQQVGLLTTSATNAGFLTALYVPMVPVLGWLFFGRKPHWVVWPAALACVLGTWLLAGHQGGDTTATTFVVGDLWVLGSSLPWALHVALVGWVSARWNVGYVLALVQFIVCSVLALAVSVMIEPWSWAAIQGAGWAILYTGAVSVGIGYTGQVVAQRHTHASDAALIMSSETVFAALFGALLMGDRLTTSGWLGCGLILVAIVVSQWLPLRQSGNGHGASEADASHH